MGGESSSMFYCIIYFVICNI